MLKFPKGTQKRFLKSFDNHNIISNNFDDHGGYNDNDNKYDGVISWLLRFSLSLEQVRHGQERERLPRRARNASGRNEVNRGLSCKSKSWSQLFSSIII